MQKKSHKHIDNVILKCYNQYHNHEINLYYHNTTIMMICQVDITENRGGERMIKKNADIRKAAKESGVYLWEIADKLGVSEPTLNRWLRKEMPESQKAKFYSTIEQVKLEHQAETAND